MPTGIARQRLVASREGEERAVRNPGPPPLERRLAAVGGALLSHPHDRRTRLMAWNMLTLALILALVGGLIDYAVRASLIRSIDRELESSQPPFRPLQNDRPDEIRNALLPPRGGHGPHGHGPDENRDNPPARNGAQGNEPLSQEPRRDSPPNDSQPPQSANDSPPDDGGQKPAGNDLQGGPTGRRFPPDRGDWDSVWRRPRIFDAQGVLLSPPNVGEVPANPAAFAQALAGRPVPAVGVIADEPARLLYKPILFQGRVVAVGQSAYPTTEVNRTLSGMRGVLLTLVPVALLLAGIGGAWLTDRALRPVRQITVRGGAHRGGRPFAPPAGGGRRRIRPTRRHIQRNVDPTGNNLRAARDSGSAITGTHRAAAALHGRRLPRTANAAHDYQSEHESAAALEPVAGRVARRGAGDRRRRQFHDAGWSKTCFC